MSEVARKLTVLAEDASACTCCELSSTRTKSVFGRGDPTSGFVVIGEAPGADEDQSGIPFVGRSGKLLDEMMKEAGVGSYYVMNAIKCRPPGNRTPTREELMSCHPWFGAQLGLVQPRVLLALGKTAARALNVSQFMPEVGWRGIEFDEDRFTRIVVTFHPAYVLRTPGSRRYVVEDIRKAHAWKPPSP